MIGVVVVVLIAVLIVSTYVYSVGKPAEAGPGEGAQPGAGQGGEQGADAAGPPQGAGGVTGAANIEGVGQVGGYGGPGQTDRDTTSGGTDASELPGLPGADLPFAGETETSSNANPPGLPFAVETVESGAAGETGAPGLPGGEMPGAGLPFGDKGGASSGEVGVPGLLNTEQGGIHGIPPGISGGGYTSSTLPTGVLSITTASGEIITRAN